jgi:hypothetical protein
MMTEGEKMVWAAAFALEFHRVSRGTSPNGPGHEHARLAAVFANAAVTALRFGAPDGEFRNAITERPWPP